MILLFCISSTTSLIFKLLSGYELVKNGMLQTESGIIETVVNLALSHNQGNKEVSPNKNSRVTR